MSSVPESVIELARQRQEARATKNWALSDQLRDQILQQGFEVVDVDGGFSFRAKNPFPVYERIGDLRFFTEKRFQICVGLIVDGFVDDAVISIQAVKKFATADTAIAIIICGTPDLGSIAQEIDDRTFITQINAGVGWGEAANALLKLSPAPYMVIMDPSTIFTGDAITPALAKLNEGVYSAVGWHGGLVNLDDDWRSIEDKGNGDVDALFSYFMALNVEHALGAGGFNSRAIFYRSADIEFSLRLRQARGRLLQMELPLEQARHHGYYDSDETFRNEQSKKTYDRILDRFRGKTEILVERR
jgi:hypothetical protein